jgi:hypothetical protein
MDKSDSIKELATALNIAQGCMSGAKKSASNPFFKSKYADLKEVIDVAKGPLSENGLSFSQFPISDDGKCGVETILMHSSGEWISNKLLLACSKQDPQGYGSAISYAKRYSLQAILGCPSEDDDGNAATLAVKGNDFVKQQVSIGNKEMRGSGSCSGCGISVDPTDKKCYTCNMKSKG